jgi:hypothetical protein
VRFVTARCNVGNVFPGEKGVQRRDQWRQRAGRRDRESAGWRFTVCVARGERLSQMSRAYSSGFFGA